MLGNVLSNVGYNGFKEGLFLQLIHVIESAVDRNFDTFSSEAKRKVLISNVNREALKSGLAGVIKRTADRHNPATPWFDKTCNPEMILSIPTIKQLWPDSLFVFAKRRGIENVASRMKKFPRHSFTYHCVDWARNMRVWREVRDRLSISDFVEIDQQELLNESELTARKISEFLGLEHDSIEKISALLSSSRPQESERGSATKVHSFADVGWTDEQVNIFQSKCDEEMKLYGYLYTEDYSVTATWNPQR